MGTVQILATEVIKIPPSTNSTVPPNHKIDLTPWDLQLLPFGTIQMGLLYHNPIDKPNQINNLKHSLSTALSFFPPFAGRFEITEHENDTASCSIVCNNEGALFVHAVADKITVTDITGPSYIPPVLHSFFPLNGVNNYQGTSLPLLAVQVTELVDGIIIAFTINHVVVDGTSTWHFINSWAEISRAEISARGGGDHSGDNGVQISQLPSLKRWFPDGIEPPILFPSSILKTFKNSEADRKLEFNQSQRLFHFSKEKIAKLKSKANAEAGKTEISSLQSLLTHVWRSVTRSKGTDSNEDVYFLIDIGVRPRIVPPFPDGYFGNALQECVVTMKVGELLEEGGLGKGALEMNKMIRLHSDDKLLKNYYESWLKKPSFIGLGGARNSNSLVISCTPRFDIYGNDFGWGKPVASRNGNANKTSGKITVYAGAENGSVDVEMCLPYEILEVVGNDSEFMDFVSK